MNRALKVLMLLALILVPAGVFVWSFLQKGISVGLAVMLGVVSQVGAMMDQSLSATNAELQQNPAVVERLGQPLIFPAIEDVEWLQPSPNSPADQMTGRYFIVGPNGEAEVTMKVIAGQQTLQVVEVSVAPVDGSDSIGVRPPIQ